MQLTKENIYNRSVIGVAGSFWVLGLLVAGSESLYMPWLNGAGAIVFFGASLWLGRALPKLGTSAIIPPSPKASRERVRVKAIEKKNHPGVNTRYAGGYCLNAEYHLN
ncbi:MAG: hypothetical protein KKF12_05435 [Proteobacteria bacterium]|nr:hypothetical protein [Desulfobacula sp.]MBU3953590.1 hypothetical protein [Pseudomonadota bacterium]MBU4130242.1 hypothetical protein [Pseudomonadota bacterium]